MLRHIAGKGELEAGSRQKKQYMQKARAKGLWSSVSMKVYVGEEMHLERCERGRSWQALCAILKGSFT